MKKLWILLFFVLLLPLYLGSQEPAALEKQPQEVTDPLLEFGLKGKMVKEGFLVEAAEGTAAITGLQKGNIITRIAGQAPSTSADVASKLKRTSVVSSLLVLSGTEVQELAWPPVDTKQLPADDLKNLELTYNLGMASLRQSEYGKALEYFQKALATSLHYPYRSDLYLGMCRVYADLAQSYLEQWTIVSPQLKNLATLQLSEARKLTDRLKKIVDSGLYNADAARKSLDNVRLEIQRAGALSRKAEEEPEEFKALEETVSEQTKALATAQATLKETAWQLDRRDFEKWVRISGIKAWWNINYFPDHVLYSANVEVTLRNSSRDFSFEAVPLEVRIIDPAGDVIDQMAKSSDTILAGQTSSVLIEGTKTFSAVLTYKEEDRFIRGAKEIPARQQRYLRGCKARLFVKGNRVGEVFLTQK